MAISKALLASLLMFYLVVHFVHSVDIMVNSNGSGRSLLQKIVTQETPETDSKFVPDESRLYTHGDADCGARCSERCKLSGRPKLCHRACGTCCTRCNCVPPGTYGNYDVCPCYANMTTHGGRRKCP